MAISSKKKPLYFPNKPFRPVLLARSFGSRMKSLFPLGSTLTAGRSPFCSSMVVICLFDMLAFSLSIPQLLEVLG